MVGLASEKTFIRQNLSSILAVKNISTLVLIKVFSLRRMKMKAVQLISRKVSLSDLPDDVLLEVYLWLGLQEIKSLRMVSNDTTVCVA